MEKQKYILNNTYGINGIEKSKKNKKYCIY